MSKVIDDGTSGAEQSSPPIPDDREFPELHLIDEAAIAHWLKIPEKRQVQISLTRGDFDQLFLSMSALFQSELNLHQTMIEQSMGELERANAFFREARRSAAVSHNAFRLFFEAVIKNAHEGSPS